MKPKQQHQQPQQQPRDQQQQQQQHRKFFDYFLLSPDNLISGEVMKEKKSFGKRNRERMKRKKMKKIFECDQQVTRMTRLTFDWQLKTFLLYNHPLAAPNEYSHWTLMKYIAIDRYTHSLKNQPKTHAHTKILVRYSLSWLYVLPSLFSVSLAFWVILILSLSNTLHPYLPHIREHTHTHTHSHTH